jgi:hypothetical protein
VDRTAWSNNAQEGEVGLPVPLALHGNEEVPPPSPLMRSRLPSLVAQVLVACLFTEIVLSFRFRLTLMM